MCIYVCLCDRQRSFRVGVAREEHMKSILIHGKD